MRNKPLLYAVPLAFAAMIAGMWLANTRYTPHSSPGREAGALWALGFPDADGRFQALSQWRGQVVVLNFWASWCNPCREEMPDFSALRTEYRPLGVEFIGIAIDNSANVAKFLRQRPVDYPILIGEGAANSLARQLGNPSGALPFTIVLDRRGNIVLRHLGRLPRAALDSVLHNAAHSAI